MGWVPAAGINKAGRAFTGGRYSRKESLMLTPTSKRFGVLALLAMIVTVLLALPGAASAASAGAIEEYFEAIETGKPYFGEAGAPIEEAPELDSCEAFNAA